MPRGIEIVLRKLAQLVPCVNDVVAVHQHIFLRRFEASDERLLVVGAQRLRRQEIAPPDGAVGALEDAQELLSSSGAPPEATVRR